MNKSSRFVPILFKPFFVCLILIQSFSCKNPVPAKNDFATPVDLEDGIEVGSLSDAGIDSTAIFQLSEQIQSGTYPNIHSLLIYRKDHLVFENYYPGKDENWGNDLGVIPHNINQLHDIRSVTKSIVSACIGIAIQQGKILNVDQKVFEFFNEYAAQDTGLKKNLTLKHLLTMTSGLEWNEDLPYDNPQNSEIQMSQSKDPIGYILSRPMVAEPGTVWNYNGGTTQLLAILLENKSAQRVDAFANEHLFKPLGINQFEWTPIPGLNQPAAASGLRLRSRDLLKFGILYHRGGKWKDQQLISPDWIEESFKSFVSQPRGGDYGYQFWIFNDSINHQSLRLVAAVGNGDQRIFFDKKNDLVVVITAGNYNNWNIKNNSAAVMRKIYEAMVNGSL